MPASEFADWVIFERIYGPLSLHERVDIDFARLTYYLVSIFSKRRIKARDFLPKYMQDMISRRTVDPDQLRAFFEGLADANDSHPGR